ncbi:hypothetical protein Tsubulata_045734 [Turnera subulata]|uniref:PPM-type phosphatase domain-containing protein n=1 Tax=Turnera subulata TaxID=218843 RepID=A0A9Q0FNP1_9ROSI|nr:hypothetical protein Tsubulata_045734 [Turnera subulata]
MGSCLSAEASRGDEVGRLHRHRYQSCPLPTLDPPAPPPSTLLQLGAAGAPAPKGKMAEMEEAKMEMRLHRVPGRFFLNASTHSASLFSKQGKKGINQDAMLVWENFGLKGDAVLCGVFDGHGPNGHMVAKQVRDSLPLKLKAHWELNSCRTECSNASGNFNPTGISEPINGKHKNNISQNCGEKRYDVFPTLKESFLKAFKLVDKELKVHPYIDCVNSGSTAVTIVKQGQDLVIGNVGDSRAVLGTRDTYGSVIAVQLTEDHKPTLPREAERIRLCKGRVFALPGEAHVARVWLPNSYSPGLAMARAFGDFCLKDFGLISVPEVFYHRITEEDEFVVLASDGLWDVLSNEEVVRIVASAPRSRAAQTLVDTAARAWKTKFPAAKVDDCAVVCLFLRSRSEGNDAHSSIDTQPSTDLTGTSKSGQ